MLSYFSSLSVVSHAFSALCMYSKFNHHPHPRGYLCAKFCFFCSFHCWASPLRKIVYSPTQSITQLIWCAGNHSPCTSEYTSQNLAELRVKITCCKIWLGIIFAACMRYRSMEYTADTASIDAPCLRTINSPAVNLQDGNSTSLRCVVPSQYDVHKLVKLTIMQTF